MEKTTSLMLIAVVVICVLNSFQRNMNNSSELDIENTEILAEGENNAKVGSNWVQGNARREGDRIERQYDCIEIGKEITCAVGSKKYEVWSALDYSEIESIWIYGNEWIWDKPREQRPLEEAIFIRNKN